MFDPCRAWAGASASLISGILQGSGNGCERGGGKGGNARGRSRRGKCERPHDDAPGEFDLEKIVAGRFCVGERRLRRAPEGGGSGIGACQRLFRRARPPWFGSDATEREPRF